MDQGSTARLFAERARSVAGANIASPGPLERGVGRPVGYPVKATGDSGRAIHHASTLTPPRPPERAPPCQVSRPKGVWDVVCLRQHVVEARLRRIRCSGLEVLRKRPVHHARRSPSSTSPAPWIAPRPPFPPARTSAG